MTKTHGETNELPPIPKRNRESHKGTYGRVGIVAGSRGMSGAAVLAGTASLRSGAGLATVACPASIQPIVAASEPCLMTLALPEDDRGRVTQEAAEHVLDRPWDALLIGPGLGQSPGVDRFVRRIVQAFTGPIVIDADGLNSLARGGDLRGLSRSILTPHAGEFQRLVGKSADEPIVDRVGSACELQRRTGGVIILKGAGTVVVGPDDYRINTTGNPGMATGGTGDVLAGMLVGLLGQGWSAFDAGRLAVHLHGLAGDIAAREKGEISLMARDLLDAIPRAFIQYTGH